MLLNVKKIFICFLVLFSVEVWAEKKPVMPENISGAITLSAEEVVEQILINPDLVVVDSRKKTEYAKGHIEGAVNILNTEMNRQDLEKIAPDKTKPILFYCNGVRCMRSYSAVSMALDWGYKNIFWFRGGWSEWTEKRLPVISE